MSDESEMIYLSGCVHEALPPSVGVMMTPAMGNRLPDNRVFACDTGCFNQPDAFDPVRYFDWLAERRHAADRCLFATAPDVWGDGRATVAKSLAYFRVIRALGYKAALVAQPGTRIPDVPWGRIDALFIGGEDDWQYSADVLALIAEAKRRDLWVHRGRVNSLRRLKDAALMGCDSADGTFVAFGPDVNIPRLRKWIATMDAQPALLTVAPSAGPAPTEEHGR